MSVVYYYFSVFVLLPIVCPKDLEEMSLGSANTLKIGESCLRDYQCIKNAFCRSQRDCMCDPPYTPNIEGTVCHAAAGTNCGPQIEDCSTMSNSECIQGVCACRNNYFLDINNSSNCIIRPSRVDDACQRTDECADTLDGALCINNKCKCYGNFIFVNQTGKCIQAVGIFMPCKHNYQCYEKDKPDELICTDGECAYKLNGGTSNFPVHCLTGVLVSSLYFLRIEIFYF
ncbi:uncharacterized protein LOC141525333 isoform X2 [Cotesia typhae]|uniref:uncharacterized protein LOC141525333 isoform X2 n=1 Tax=Cotesia typhae TaxID=2053667 RepID=UPI003D698221